MGGCGGVVGVEVGGHGRQEKYGSRRPLGRWALTLCEGGSRRRVSSGGMMGYPWLPLKSQCGGQGQRRSEVSVWTEGQATGWPRGPMRGLGDEGS